MKSITKLVLTFVFSFSLFIGGCNSNVKKEQKKDDVVQQKQQKKQKEDEFCYEFEGRPGVAIKYSEMIAMLRQYDNKKKEALTQANGGKEDTRVHFFNIEDLKAYLAYVEKLSQNNDITLTGINIIAAAYPEDYAEKEKRNHQTLIFMPTTEIRGKIDVSFDPIYSKPGKPKPLAEILHKLKYKDQWVYGKPFAKMSAPVDEASMFSLFDEQSLDDDSAAANRLRPSPPH